MTILIVEDNPSVRRLLRHAIQEIAHTVVECEDGADSLKGYKDCMPDVVLMDVRMPRMDGLTATRRLLQAYPDARVVIVTDYDDDELRNAAHEAGAKQFALKNNLTELDSIIVSVAGMS